MRSALSDAWDSIEEAVDENLTRQAIVISAENRREAEMGDGESLVRLGDAYYYGESEVTFNTHKH